MHWGFKDEQKCKLSQFAKNIALIASRHTCNGDRGEEI